MIRVLTAVRTMPALWLAIPISILAGWYVTLLDPSDGYGVDATAKASMTLAFVGSFCAGCAAWEGSRLRRAALWNAPSVRSRMTIAFWSLLPVVLVGLTAVLVGIAIQLARSSAGPPDLRIIIVAALNLVAYSVFGFALGVLLPFAVAGPLAIVVPFVWVAFVPAMYPVWLRHLTGMFRDCCGLAQDLALRPVIGSSLLDAGIIGAFALLISGPAPAVRRLRGAAVTLGLASGAGALLVAGMGYAPVVPRDVGRLECRAADRVSVCTWPEHRALSAELIAIVTRVRDGWEQAGIDAPSVFTEADRSVAQPSALVFLISSYRFTNDDVVSALATGKLPATPDCAGGYTGGIAFEYLAAWYSASGGMTVDGLTERYGYDADPYTPVLTVVEKLRAAPVAVRQRWVARAETVSQACGDWPLELIAVNP